MRRLNIRWSIRLHIDNGEVQDRVTTLSLHNPRREFHATKIFVLSVNRVKKHVAEHVVVNPGLDLFHHILVIDVPVDLRLVLPHERQDTVFLATDRLRFDRCIVGRRGFEETMRRHPDFQLLDPRRV